MRHTRTQTPALLLWLISMFFSASAAAQGCVALVIGNAAYTDAPLKNPLHDAQDMAHTLRALGCEVLAVTNAGKKQMLEAVNEFGGRLPQAQVGVFYYSGHGVQYHGKNYLIPLHATIGAPADLEQETVDAGRILGRMEHSKIALNVVILDACRNNPFRNLLGFRSYGDRGLAAMAPPVRGALIAYATQPDNVASDGTGRNGTYTKHLLQYLPQPGLSLPELFNAVGLAVSAESNGAQVPWMNTSPLPRFCFAGCQAGSAPVLPPQPPRQEPLPIPRPTPEPTGRGALDDYLFRGKGKR